MPRDCLKWNNAVQVDRLCAYGAYSSLFFTITIPPVPRPYHTIVCDKMTSHANVMKLVRVLDAEGRRMRYVVSYHKYASSCRAECDLLDTGLMRM